MFNLMWGYLFVITLLFSTNIGLLLGNFKLNDKKAIMNSCILGILLFVLTNVSNRISFNLLDYMAYIFIIIAIAVFIVLAVFLKQENFKNSIVSIIVLFYVSALILTFQIDGFYIFDSLFLSIISIIIMFIAYKTSNLLKYAKRPYNVIVGEYMSLEGILIFLFGLTFISIMQLDYTMFSSFLILTPTYQLIYVIIGIIIILIIGTYWNDKK